MTTTKDPQILAFCCRYCSYAAADLAGSNNTIWSDSVDVNEGTENGNYVYFGVREFGMTAVLNGMALHGGVIPVIGTFFVFSDYMKPAARLSALQEIPVKFIWTHDAFRVGEDGPTHQPVEHITSLRTIPNLLVLRPADGNETSAAWKVALERVGGQDHSESLSTGKVF